VEVVELPPLEEIMELVEEQEVTENHQEQLLVVTQQVL
jgi:hypothetical protein